MKKTSADDKTIQIANPHQKKPAKDIDMTKNKLLQKCINVVKAPTTASLPVTASGEDQTFGRFVAEKLMSFDRHTKLMAEKRITELLFELEMGMLTESHSEWDFNHVTSSPDHHTSNSKAESAIKIIKSTIKKS